MIAIVGKVCTELLYANLANGLLIICLSVGLWTKGVMMCSRIACLRITLLKDISAGDLL